MPTLKQIQLNKVNKQREKQKIKENYKSPHAFSIVIQFLKQQNKEYIHKILKENGYNDEKYFELIINKFLLLGNYCPEIVQKKKKEKLQYLSVSK